MDLQNIYDLEYAEFRAIALNSNFKEVHAFNFYSNLYKKSTKEFIDTNYPGHFKSFIQSNFDFQLPKIIKIQKSSDDETIKLLSELNDGSTIETVLVPFHKKYTICISSQVGCAMKCSFCFTGTQGLKRHLRVSEILGQYVLAYNYILENFQNKKAAPNIVFMGQGEPLHNFENIKKAIAIFLSPAGLNLGPRQITLSTAGFLPGLKRFSELYSINLALSFHSPFNEQRNELIPINTSYPITELVSVIKDIPRLKRQYITIEYLVIDELNHSYEHALEIKKIFQDLPIIINLIPFNEFPGSKYKRPDSEKVESFKKLLKELGFPTLKRTTKGDDILAACGQLNTKNSK